MQTFCVLDLQLACQYKFKQKRLCPHKVVVRPVQKQ